MEVSDPTTKQTEELAKLRIMLDEIRAARPRKMTGHSSMCVGILSISLFVVAWLAVLACIQSSKNKRALVHLADALLDLATSVERLTKDQRGDGLHEMSEFVDKLRFGDGVREGIQWGHAGPNTVRVSDDSNKEGSVDSSGIHWRPDRVDGSGIHWRPVKPDTTSDVQPSLGEERKRKSDPLLDPCGRFECGNYELLDFSGGGAVPLPIPVSQAEKSCEQE